MPTDVIMPALELAQETGKVLRWLKAPGDTVRKGEAVECPQCHAAQVERLLSVPARPRNGDQSLPMSCDPKLPPCGPGCCRLPN